MEERLADLITGVAGRDEEALRRLHERLSGAVFAIAYVRLHDADAAEDVRQETFLRIWLHADSFRPTDRADGGVRAWVLAIARNLATDRHRRTAREIPVADPPPKRTPLDGDAIAAALDLRALLAGLPRGLREAVVLRVLAGLSVQECGEELSVSAATVKRRCRRGLDLLGERIGRERETRPADREEGDRHGTA